ncbi:formate dehydrogenase accessory sulfurtransferase FdhD [Lichenifustis flavocetrariae]|uniref:Sulfur carrier protein FdhD n=1 Tax=Lichenifustis flavocetrariae TaxID=2949735 RepID=A0AA41YW86_9HYPH|nr:formate dehydrogenase accessory sulfurtransferase FdhD [Lichenifustis flavocetrariae]MCW6508128.1 formate dehydrogenase accessory sulfurtransferase FdhD [Lichenifustis flavocetrariae]
MNDKCDPLSQEELPARRAAATRTFTFAGAVADGLRSVAIERPVQVSYGDVPFGVMMLTPEDLEDFAFGFSLTEGVIDGVSDVRAVTIAAETEGLRLRIDLTGAKLHAHLARKRALSGRTSCGLCGIEDLSSLVRATSAREPAPRVNLGAIRRALQDLETRQPLNNETHAVHGAAWCGRDGAILQVREDVGRHNALDKLIGALVRSGISPEAGFLLITSRASFEMVEKAATFGCRTLVAISAPTALALDRAAALDLTLVGIARRDAVTVFHGADRIVPEGLD